MKIWTLVFLLLVLGLSMSGCTKNDPLDNVSGLDNILEKGKLRDSSLVSDVTSEVEIPSEENLAEEKDKAETLKTNIKINDQLFEGTGQKNQAVPTIPPTMKPLTTVGKLIIQDIVIGKGKEASEGAVLTVHYDGTLTNGVKFDSSIDRGQPFNFKLGQGEVIKGWDQGLLGMKEGGKRMLTIPADMAYGNQVRGNIPAGATLVFEIELLKVQEE